LHGFFHVFSLFFEAPFRCLMINQHGICQDLYDSWWAHVLEPINSTCRVFGNDYPGGIPGPRFRPFVRWRRGVLHILSDPILASVTGSSQETYRQLQAKYSGFFETVTSSVSPHWICAKGEPPAIGMRWGRGESGESSDGVGRLSAGYPRSLKIATAETGKGVVCAPPSPLNLTGIRGR